MSLSPNSSRGGVTGGAKAILRLEGLIVLAVASLAYSTLGGSWGVFAMLFLVPDLSMLGYLKGARMGAAAYNFGHSYIVPLGLGIAAHFYAPAYEIYLLIWIAHIGFDRALGYGLKYNAGFGVTHLGLVGKIRSATKEAMA